MVLTLIKGGSGAAGMPNSMWAVMGYSLKSMLVTEKSVICMSEHITVKQQKATSSSFMPVLQKVRFKGGNKRRGKLNLYVKSEMHNWYTKKATEPPR